ncbi:DHH family phosphoesterase [Halalkalicoccus salilacus]|uniref:DHH family phosphoesterase n=1 Tax=Halalkalicoccus TaxID=332246 RepID=UPI002F961944
MSQAGELFDYLTDTESLAIICHWNPDPDCIASALALETIAMEAGVADVRIFYSGALGHQQNRGSSTCSTSTCGRRPPTCSRSTGASRWSITRRLERRRSRWVPRTWT